MPDGTLVAWGGTKYLHGGRDAFNPDGEGVKIPSGLSKYNRRLPFVRVRAKLRVSENRVKFISTLSSGSN